MLIQGYGENVLMVGERQITLLEAANQPVSIVLEDDNRKRLELTVYYHESWVFTVGYHDSLTLKHYVNGSEEAKQLAGLNYTDVLVVKDFEPVRILQVR